MIEADDIVSVSPGCSKYGNDYIIVSVVKNIIKNACTPGIIKKLHGTIAASDS